jgi:HEAT repeat protein
MSKIQIAFVITLAFLMTACDIENTASPSFGQPQYKNSATCPLETQEMIKQYAIGDVIVRCESQIFNVDGKDVYLVLLEFGPGEDCLAGCIFKHYCAVIEDGVEYPYTFPPHSHLGTLRSDWEFLTGRKHKITSLSEFRTFVNNDTTWGVCAAMSTWERQEATAEAKLKLDVKEENIPIFIQILQYDQDWENRGYAAVALGLIGTGKEDAIAALIQALKDEHYEVRLSVISALEEIGPEGRGVVLALAQALNDENPNVMAASIRVLTLMGPDAIEAVPSLINVLKDEEKSIDTRAGAIWALNRIGPGAVDAIPALIQALEDGNWKVRGLAVRTLGEMGPEAIDAIPALIKILEQDENAAIRADAAVSIREINPKAVNAIPALVQAVEDDYWPLQRAAIQTLRGIGPDAKSAVPVLIRALEDDDWQVREIAVSALRDITGWDFDNDADPSVWQKWWEEEN